MCVQDEIRLLQLHFGHYCMLLHSSGHHLKVVILKNMAEQNSNSNVNIEEDLTLYMDSDRE